MVAGSLEEFASFACALADAARQVTVPATASIRQCRDKSTAGAFDPVTDADRQAELAMRAMIEARHPDHGIAGEEFDEKPAEGAYVWSLDPIDGTRSFICGLPSWTTLIALVRSGEPVIGLIDAPMLGERYLAFEGSARLIRPAGALALAASDCRALGEARLSTTDPYLFAGDEAAGFERLRRSVRIARYGQDGYAYARLAAGDIDLVVESGLQPHDVHALVPVVRDAGGVIGDWDGASDFAQGSIVAAATAQLYKQAVAVLGRQAAA